MSNLETAASVQAMAELMSIIDNNRTLKVAFRRLEQAGGLAALTLLLTQCGAPISKSAQQTVIARMEQQAPPTETPRAGLFDRTAVAAAPANPPRPVETPGPDIEANHQILFGIIDLDNSQRLRIQQTNADIEIEIATTPGTTAPKFRNPFTGAKISAIYEPGSPIAQQYGPSLCLQLADGQTTVCLNNLSVISADAKTALANKTPLEVGMILGAIGSATNLQQYPALLPDSGTYRGLISVTQAGQKKPIQDILPEFKNRDTRNDPK